MKLQILALLWSTATASLWPAPVNYTSGSSFVWIQKDLSVTYNNKWVRLAWFLFDIPAKASGKHSSSIPSSLLHPTRAHYPANLPQRPLLRQQFKEHLPPYSPTSSCRGSSIHVARSVNMNRSLQATEFFSKPSLLPKLRRIQHLHPKRGKLMSLIAWVSE